VHDEVAMLISARSCSTGELLQVGQPHQVPSSLTSSQSTPAGRNPASTGQVDRGLGVSGRRKHAAGLARNGTT